MAEGSLEGAEQIGGVIAVFKGENADFLKAVDDVQKKLKDTDKQTETFTEKIKQKLKSVKAEGGKSSVLGQSAQLLKGAGAVAGVSLIGRELENATAKMADLNAAFRRGELSAGDLAVKIGESLPIIGHFVTAGQNIREMFTHERAKLDEINKAIEFGTTRMKQRAAAAELTRNAIRGMTEKAISFGDKTALLGADNAREKKKLEVEIEFKNGKRSLDEDLKKQIEERKKLLVEAEDEIAKRFKGDDSKSGKREKHEQIAKARDKSRDDIDGITKAAQASQAAMDKWATAAAVDANSIRDDLRKLNDEIANKLAVTTEEKLSAFSAQLQQNGYDASQAAELTAKYASSLRADKVAEFKTALKDVNDQIRTLGKNEREVAARKALWVDGMMPRDVNKLKAALDDLASKQHLIAMGNQVDSFGTTALERTIALMKSLGATAAQTQSAIELQAKIDGQEKLQQLHDILKQINEETQDAGKSNIQKQIDQMIRLADASGMTADKLAKIVAAQKQLEQAKVKDFIKQTKDETAQVGISEADAVVAKLKAEGITDPKLLADAWTAAAAKAGAILRDSLQTPLDRFIKQQAELQKLLKAGAISKGVFNAAQQRNFNSLTESLPSRSIEEDFQENLKRQLVAGAVDNESKRAAKEAADAQKAATEAAKKQAEKTSENSNALQKLNDTLKGGVAAQLT